jgi:PAS domain S-box-containing protein
MTPRDLDLNTLLEAVVETTASVCLALRPDHTVMFWNRAAEALYGVPREQAHGMNYVATFIAPEQQDAIAADIRKVLAGEPTWDFEDDSVLADGSRRTLVWNVRRVLGADGEPVA